MGVGSEGSECPLQVSVSREVITASSGTWGQTPQLGSGATSSIKTTLAEFRGLELIDSLGPAQMPLSQCQGSGPSQSMSLIYKDTPIRL